MAEEEEEIFFPMSDSSLERIINRTLNSPSSAGDPSNPMFFTSAERKELLDMIVKEPCYKDVMKSKPEADEKFKRVFLEIGKFDVFGSGERNRYSSTYDILYALGSLTPHQSECILHSIAKSLSTLGKLAITDEEKKEYQERLKKLTERQEKAVSSVISAKTGVKTAGRRKTRRTGKTGKTRRQRKY